MSFSKDFVWGGACASYQLEGGWDADGKGLNVWDTFSHTPGKIRNDETGDVACDHYHRYAGDVELLQNIGLQAYRCSISWARVLPEGVGRVNEKGMEFYDRLIDKLLDAGIEPWVTLFHWDYPYELYCRGGWLNRESAAWFGEYATLIAERLGDRVSHWMTMNEPQCFLGLGHVAGIHAPGLKLSYRDFLRATHNALRAHGQAVQALRAHAQKKPFIGWAPVGITKIPVSDKPEDIEAARADMFVDGGDMFEVADEECFSNSWYSDPVVFGKYPEAAQKAFEEKGIMPEIAAGDMAEICQPLDFYGANIYHGVQVCANSEGKPERVKESLSTGRTMMDWPVTPAALYWGPKFLHERYKLPIVVTENGLAGMDWVALDGKVHDPQRIDFLQRYLREYRRAAADGVPLLGYFQWSVMDNYEWALGYSKRFGLIHVDYETQKRTLKDSAYWYRDVIASNGENL